MTTSAEGWHVDVAALRAETIERDLEARDFTVNAIAVPLSGGEPIDPSGGLADAESAAPARLASERAFEQDPLRLLRAVRIAARHRSRDRRGHRALAPGRRLREPASPPGSASSPSSAGSSAGRARCAALGADGRAASSPRSSSPSSRRLRGVVQNPNHHLDVHGHTLEGARASGSTIERRPARVQPATLPRRSSALLAEPLADELTPERGAPLRRPLPRPRQARDPRRAPAATSPSSATTRPAPEITAADLPPACAPAAGSATHLAGPRPATTCASASWSTSARSRRRTVYEYLRATEPVGADVTLLSVADRLAARAAPARSPATEMIEAHLELAREMLADALAWHRRGPARPAAERRRARGGARPETRPGDRPACSRSSGRRPTPARSATAARPWIWRAGFADDSLPGQ